MSGLMLSSSSAMSIKAGSKVPDEQHGKTLEIVRNLRGDSAPRPIDTEPVIFLERMITAGIPNSREITWQIKDALASMRRARELAKEQKLNNSRAARIVAFVPTYEAEDQIDRTIEGLLLQSRRIDKIVVCVNGPGESSVAYDKAIAYAKEKHFKGWLDVIRPEGLAGKVNALNYMFEAYVAGGYFDFVLGVDADVVPDNDMVLHLDEDLNNFKQAGGVMARYSFLHPSHDEMKGASKHLIHGQRHEFASVGINQQLRGNTSEILGGQATLFRADLLMAIAKVTSHGRYAGPWDINSKVEDAKLTREIQKLGKTSKTSAKARAWTGLMYTPHTWQKQRRKWQDGHLEDITGDFHPLLDWRRWSEQWSLGWNLLIRIAFAALLATSISLDRFVFAPIWLIPMGLAILQSFLVALKVPDRRLIEIFRSLLFIPNEIYYVRTLSIWLDSIVVMFLNIKRDGWKNQAAAEASKKKSAISVWLIIALAVAAPSLGFIMLSKLIPVEAVDIVLHWSWTTLSIMTALSVVAMAWKILRIMRRFRTLAP